MRRQHVPITMFAAYAFLFVAVLGNDAATASEPLPLVGANMEPPTPQHRRLYSGQGVAPNPPGWRGAAEGGSDWWGAGDPAHCARQRFAEHFHTLELRVGGTNPHRTLRSGLSAFVAEVPAGRGT